MHGNACVYISCLCSLNCVWPPPRGKHKQREKRRGRRVQNLPPKTPPSQVGDVLRRDKVYSTERSLQLRCEQAPTRDQRPGTGPGTKPNQTQRTQTKAPSKGAATPSPNRACSFLFAKGVASIHHVHFETKFSAGICGLKPKQTQDRTQRNQNPSANKRKSPANTPPHLSTLNHSLKGVGGWAETH